MKLLNYIGSVGLVILVPKCLYVNYTGHEMHDKITTIPWVTLDLKSKKLN